MAAVQRTRIGYGNEGRTKQLAASLSDFIRLFSLYRPASPNKTTHQISCCALLGGGGGGGVFHRGTFPPSSPPEVHWLRQNCSDFGAATRASKRVSSPFASQSHRSSESLFQLQLFSPLGFSFPPFLSVTFACARRELRVKRTKRCSEEGVSKFSLARKVAGVHLSREGRRVEQLFLMFYGGAALLTEL